MKLKDKMSLKDKVRYAYNPILLDNETTIRHLCDKPERVYLEEDVDLHVQQFKERVFERLENYRFPNNLDKIIPSRAQLIVKEVIEEVFE